MPSVPAYTYNNYRLMTKKRLTPSFGPNRVSGMSKTIAAPGITLKATLMNLRIGQTKTTCCWLALPHDIVPNIDNVDIYAIT